MTQTAVAVYGFSDVLSDEMRLSTVDLASFCAKNGATYGVFGDISTFVMYDVAAGLHYVVYGTRGWLCPKSGKIVWDERKKTLVRRLRRQMSLYCDRLYFTPLHSAIACYEEYSNSVIGLKMGYYHFLDAHNVRRRRDAATKYYLVLRAVLSPGCLRDVLFMRAFVKK